MQKMVNNDNVIKDNILLEVLDLEKQIYDLIQ